MRVFDESKFKELVLYIASESKDHGTFGATKLNKILFYSDFLAFGELGDSITGATYQKLQYGPAPREIKNAQFELVSKGEARIDTLGSEPYAQKRTVALREPEMDAFTPGEVEIVDMVIDALANANAKQTSDFSHRAIGWQIVDDYDDIPYHTVFLSHAPATEADIERGQELAGEYGWMAA